MDLNSLKVLLVATLLGLGVAMAQDSNVNEDYLTLDSVTVSEISLDVFNQENSELLLEKKIGQKSVMRLPGMPNKMGQVHASDAGKVIGLAKELGALGEDIYKLVQKGKPHNMTSYSPISVIPRVNGNNVDIFETENWKMPTRATYEIIYKNLFGMEVVKFRYSVIFSYGGTYQGKGAYLTATQIVPVSIMTSFGFDFSAIMKLQGIQNHGTKENPVAGAIITMEYTVETVIQASLESDSYHLTGRGGFKQL